jgi:hypothetical protein
MDPVFNYKGYNGAGVALSLNDFISIDSLSGTINLSCLNNPRIGIYYIKVVGSLPNGIDQI